VSSDPLRIAAPSKRNGLKPQNLRLLIQARAVKPIGIMKTLSGTFAFVALSVIAIVTLPSCCRKQVSEGVHTDKKFNLEFGGPTKDDYVDVTQPDFDQAVKALADPGPSHGGKYKIRYKDNNGKVDDPYDPGHPHRQLNVKTDKVITSELAQNAPAGESAANDPNATYRVYSNSKTDIENVLKTFKASPTPTPSPP
jgi:hypothetical protein